MRFFTVLLDPEDRGISDEVRRSYETMPRRRGLEFAWQSFDHAEVLTAWDDAYGDPLVAREGNWLAVGTVRLDNRADLERWAECQGEGLTDLRLVLRVVARFGTKYIPQLLGDFGFVAWNSTRRTGVAASDAFGVRPLYYATGKGLLAWSSRSESIALGDELELRYLVQLLTSYAAPPGLSVYAGVYSLPPASIATFGMHPPAIRTYWSAAESVKGPAWAGQESEAIEACRQLLLESVRLRLTNPAETWGQLSGGLDSSSVVSLAAWLAEQGHIDTTLAGTITYVDRQNTQTDEREYSNAVVTRYGLRNVAILDPPMWHDDGRPPIAPDQPGLDFHVQPRELRLREAVRDGGGRTLLTGYGGDELFADNALFLADLIVKGRVRAALEEMLRSAATHRGSFWSLAYRDVLVPLLPGVLARRLVQDESPPGPWLNPEAVRRYGLGRKAAVLFRHSGPRGAKHQYAIVSGIHSLQGVVHGGILADDLQLMHPLLYRPLVEFALSLPQHLRTKGRTRRWILREAVRGILPDVVRARYGKPDTSDVLVAASRAGYERLRSLAEHPILGELGLIDPRRLQTALEALYLHRNAALSDHLALFPTLAVEAWLKIRSGRWPQGSHLSCDSNAELERISLHPAQSG